MDEPNDRFPPPDAATQPSADAPLAGEGKSAAVDPTPPGAEAGLPSADATLPDGATPPPVVGWAAWTPPEPGAPAAPEPPRRLALRVLEAVAWVIGIGAVLFLGRAFVLFNDSSSLSGFQKGELVGRIVGAVVAGVVVRWIWVKVRKHGRILSPWILLVATAGLGLGIASSPGLLLATPSTPIGTYLKVGPPYVLETAPPEISAQFATLVTSFHASASEFRQVTSDGEVVGYLLVVNIDAGDSDEFMAGAERGFEENGGAEAHKDVVAGKTVIVGTSQDVNAIIWVEAPYGLVLYAADIESGKELAASVIAAYQ